MLVEAIDWDILVGGYNSKSKLKNSERLASPGMKQRLMSTFTAFYIVFL